MLEVEQYPRQIVIQSRIILPYMYMCAHVVTNLGTIAFVPKENTLISEVFIRSVVEKHAIWNSKMY